MMAVHDLADTARLASQLAEACRTGESPTIEAEQRSILARAIDALLDAGDLQAAEHAVRHFYALFPDGPYLQNMHEIFDRLPPDNDLLPFKDDPKAEVQILRREGAQDVFFGFCGFSGRLGLPINLMHRWFGGLPASLVYLRDPRRLYFMKGIASLGEGTEATAEALHAIAKSLGARRILCYGNSAGVFPALFYGLKLQAVAVAALAGPTNVSLDFTRHLGGNAGARRLHEAAPDAPVDMRAIYGEAASAPSVRLYYGDSNWNDRLQAQNMAGLPTVTLVEVEKLDLHNVAAALIRRGEFEGMLAWLTGPHEKARTDSLP